jgi:ribosomal protein L11 methyltransferase
LIRLALRVPADEAEIVLAELLELAPVGVEEVSLDGGLIEYAVYGAPGELPSLPDLRAVAGGSLVEIATTEVADDWDRRWREFHRPLVLDGRLTVRPPWAPAAQTPIDLVIDPGQAFGTGAHATTRLCLELLLELVPGGPLLDLGCGSGVLAIAAARLGWSPVVALDHDPAAVEATAENAQVNGVEIEVRRHDLRTDDAEIAPTMTANLLAPLLLTWADRLVVLPRCVIASGLLAHEVSAVAARFSQLGLEERARRNRGEWAAVLLVAD